MCAQNVMKNLSCSPHLKNIKRHIKTVHKGLTPASAARKKTAKTEPKFKFRTCDNMTRAL